jgi:imidazolonepropionase-like amidohydrolase
MKFAKDYTQQRGEAMKLPVRAGGAALAVCMALMLAPGTRAQAPGNPPPYYALTNARIVTVSGGVIEGGTVVIANGLIAAVGKEARIPPEAWVIDAKGLTVYPGLMDALTDLGLQTGAAPAPGGAGAAPGQVPAAAQQRPSQGPQDRPGTTPWRSAADELNAADRRIEQWRSAGFTTALAMPRSGIFPGQAAVVNLGGGERAGAMVMRPLAALGITMQQPGGFAGFPGSQMGTISYVKQVFLDAAQAREALATYAANPRGVARPEYDRAANVVNEALRESRPVLLPASNEAQIARMLALGERINAGLKDKARWVLYGLTEGYAAAEAIAAKGVPVLVGVRWPERERDADPEAETSIWTLRMRDKAPSTPAALDKAGVKFAFYSDGITAPRDIIRNVKKSIDAGLKPEAALRAFTLSAAEIFGLADRLGSIEAGKIANLVVTDGDIFAERTRIKMIFVDGRKYEIAAAAQPSEPPAGNMSGTWRITVTTAQGTQDSTATISMSPDGTLTGTLASQMGTSPISDGRLSGNRFSFTIHLSMGGQTMSVSFNGTLEGNNIRGTATVGPSTAEFTGTRTPGAGETGAQGGAQ